MKCMLAAASLAFTFSLSTAQAEVQDCIEITSLPATISQQGIHCFKQDLSSLSPTGNAITISVNNVIIDMNGFKLGGLGAGAATTAIGIYAFDRQNITIRNGSIRGFGRNVYLDATGDGSSGASRGHIVEDMRIEAGRLLGIHIEGRHTIVRNNFVLDTGNGSGTIARGIFVQNGPGHTIIGNVVSGVTEVGEVAGILVSAAPGVIVRGNQIHEVSATNAFGIQVHSSPQAIIQGNSIGTSIAADVGISAAGASDICVDNVASNFASNFNGCEVNQGNFGL